MEPLDDDDERQAGVLPPGLVGPMVGGMHGKEEASAAKDFCCSKQCLAKMDTESVLLFRRDLARMDKRAREFYLLIILQQCRASPSRRGGNRQREVYMYRVQPMGDMCRPAFTYLFDISKGHLDALQLHLRAHQSILPRVHGNHKLSHVNATDDAVLSVNWLPRLQSPVSYAAQSMRAGWGHEAAAPPLYGKQRMPADDGMMTSTGADLASVSADLIFPSI